MENSNLIPTDMDIILVQRIATEIFLVIHVEIFKPWKFNK